MKLIIEHTKDKYYSIRTDFYNKNLIVKDLNISLNEFEKILIKNNAKYDDEDYNNFFPYFKNKKNAEKVLIELEPYLIMSILTEE